MLELGELRAVISPLNSKCLLNQERHRISMIDLLLEVCPYCVANALVLGSRHAVASRAIARDRFFYLEIAEKQYAIPYVNPRLYILVPHSPVTTIQATILSIYL